LVYRFAKTIVNLLFGEGDNAFKRWAPIAAALSFGIAGTTICTGIMAVHDGMSVFFLLSSLLVMHKAVEAKSKEKSTALFLASHALLLWALFSKYGFFVLGPFYVIYAYLLIRQSHPELTTKEHTKLWLKRYALPLGLATFALTFAFRGYLIPGYYATMESVTKFTQDVSFPWYRIIYEHILRDIGIYLVVGVTGAGIILKKSCARMLGIGLFFISIVPLLYPHLIGGHIVGLVKHETAVLALMAPIYGIGFVALARFVREKIKSTSLRSAAAVLLLGGTASTMYGAYAPWMSWWMNEPQFQVGATDSRVESAKRLRAIIDKLKPGERVAVREFTPLLWTGVPLGDAFRVAVKYSREALEFNILGPQKIVDDPSIVAVELYPEYEGWISVLERGGFCAEDGARGGWPKIFLRKE